MWKIDILKVENLGTLKPNCTKLKLIDDQQVQQKKTNETTIFKRFSQSPSTQKSKVSHLGLGKCAGIQSLNYLNKIL